MKDILKPEGLLLVTVPNGYGYFEMESFVQKKIPALCEKIGSFQNLLVKIFGPKELKSRRAKEHSPEHLQMSWITLSKDDQGHCQKFTSRSIRKLICSHDFDRIELI